MSRGGSGCSCSPPYPYPNPFNESCEDPQLHLMRLRIRKDLGKWSRKLLLCLGLENLGKHIVGDAKWEKLYDAGSGGSSSSNEEQPPPSKRFQEKEETGERNGEGDGDCEDTETEENQKPRPMETRGRGGRKGNAPTKVANYNNNNDCGGVEDDEEEEDGGNVEEDLEAKMNDMDGSELGEEREEVKGAGKGSESGEEEREPMVKVREEPEVEAELKNQALAVDGENSNEAQQSNQEEDRIAPEEQEEKAEKKMEVENEHTSSASQTPPRYAKNGESDDGEEVDRPEAGVEQRGRMSNSPPMSEGDAEDEDEEPPEEKPGGGALVDNLFQILPYWYFLNRALGLSGESQDGGPGVPPGLPSIPFGLPQPDGDDNELEENEGDGEEEEEGGSSGEGGVRDRDKRGASNSPPQTGRFNSFLLLESLRQQLQSQGTHMASVNSEHLNLSEIISKMSNNQGNHLPSSGSWRASHSQQNPPSPPPEDGGSGMDYEMEDQPLDLTSGSSVSVSCSRASTREDASSSSAYHSLRAAGIGAGGLLQHQQDSLSPFLLDEQTSKVFRSNPRSSKGYTAQELQAALHDIQSGKLGTRRAAVIYGIPRSTLRNKVYKLGKDRGRFFGPGITNNHGIVVNHNNNNIEGKEPSVAAATAGSSSSSLLGKLPYLQGLNQGSFLRSGRGAQRQFNSDDDREELGGSGSGSGRPGPYHPHLHPLYRHPHHHINRNGGNDTENRDMDKPGTPGPPKLFRGGIGGNKATNLSELISKHAQQQRLQSSPYHHQQQGGSGLGMGMEVEEGGDDSSQPTPPISLLSQADWKTHLLNQHHHHQQQQHSLSGNRLNSPQHSHSHSQQSVAGEDPNGLDLAGKKSRPKRGKYRNYDREALVKAVRAVQNGEMSVHRAGSFFGVPHSTLEYKVKERHLLRRPKRKEVTSPVSQAKSSSPESSSDATLLSRSSFPGSGGPSSIYSKASSGVKGISSSSNSSPYLFPLTSDLRESLSRYLNSSSSNQGPDQRSSGSPPIDPELGGGPSSQDEREPISSSSGATMPQLTPGRSNNKDPEGAFALEGLIGSRLSSLFQLNDMLIRSSSSANSSSSAAAAGTAATDTLDLSKK